MAFGDFTVVRSTVKRVLNSSGVLASVAVNTPAFEFNANGSYKGLLVEPAGTNLALYSQQFDNAAWSVVFTASVSANATTAPDGTTTADKIVESAINTLHAIGQTPTSTSGTVHTISIFAKASERTFLFLFEDSAGGRNAYFNLSNGTVGTVGGSASANIIDVGSGWYRCSVTYTSSGTLVRFRVATASANGTNTYLGDGTSGIFVWGAQAELGAVATSYIPTEGSTVTRTADDISLSSASSLIGQTSGYIYAEVNIANNGLANASSIVTLSDVIGDDVTNRIFVGKGVSNKKLDFQILQNSSFLFNFTSTGNLLSGTNKILARYGDGTSALFLNGVKLTSQAGTPSFSVPLAIVKAGFYANSIGQLNDNLRAIALGTTALSDAQAIALTTL